MDINTGRMSGNSHHQRLELLDLPPELHLQVAQALRCLRDINALSRTNRYFHELVDPYLYRRDAKRKTGASALAWAAANGRENTARKALAPLETLTRTKPLFLAASNGHEAVVRLLTAMNGVDLEFRDTYGHTALTTAVPNGCEGVVRALLEAGADPTTVGGGMGSLGVDYGPPLVMATRAGYAGIVRLLACHPKVDVNLSGTPHPKPIAYAAEKGHEEVVKVLLECGADPNAARPRQWPPLVTALRCKHRGIVKLLLAARGIDVNVTDRRLVQGETPLSLAVCQRDSAIVQLLLEAGADPNRGLPIFTALHEGDESTVQVLLSAGVSLTCTDTVSRSPLTLAAVRSPRNSAALLKLVLDAGADANAVDNYGRTALMEACETGNREAAHLLLETEGIDLEYRWRGLTAANYAQRRGHMLIAAEVTVQMWLAKRKARKLRDAASTGTDEGSRDEEGRSRLPNVRKFYANLGYEIK